MSVKVVGLKAENVKKLKVVNITPGDSPVIKISGKNEAGKTTVLDLIWWTLGGTKDIQEDPIRTGEKRAVSCVDLGDYVATRTYTPSGSTLKLESKDGALIKSPQALLDSMIGKFAFNPLDYARSDEKKQEKILLDIIDLKINVVELEGITDRTVVQGLNPLKTLDNLYQSLFDERTLITRELTKAKGALASMPEIEPVDRVVVSELVSERATKERENREQRAIHDAPLAISAKIVVYDREIIALEQQIADLQARLLDKITAINEATAESEKALLAAAQVKMHDLSEIDAKIVNAGVINSQADAFENRKQSNENLILLQFDHDGYTAKIEAVAKYRKDLLEKARFPIEGLSFANGGIIYKGVPFAQASSSQKLRVSMAIAMALNPELRVIRIDDGSLLDRASLAIIEEMAREGDFQVWMEVVDESGKVGVYMEDGEVKASNLVA